MFSTHISCIFKTLTFTAGKNLLIFVNKLLPSFSAVDGDFISSTQSRQISRKFTAIAATI
jgi:hypothetical protein